MNNVFNINKLLNTDDIKQKYTFLYFYFYKKNDNYIKLFNVKYKLKKIITNLKNIEHLIFSELKINGGLENDISILKSDSNINDIDQDRIFNKLFDMIIIKNDINYPLCNSCLKEYSPSIDSNWYTSHCTHKEIYFNDNVSYTSYNYMHICYSCNILLQLKIKKYYSQLKLIPFNNELFKEQSEQFIKYQTLCFNLLLNFNINTLNNILG